jgi:glycosyltransferase involved in cell wall biosynthesis
MPSLIHAHVLLKHAWFALTQARQHHLPLIASEQWTGYLPEAPSEFQTLTPFQKRTISKVLQYAAHVTTVSEYLAVHLKKHFTFRDYTVIPNLADTSVFKPVETTNGMATFIHISTLSSQKNFDEILTACVLLKDQQAIFRLKVFAPPSQQYAEKVKQLGLGDIVIFKPEVPQPELAKEVATAGALILYSRYETFGCVVVEANACGVPVITSDFPVFAENVREGVTGFKVPLHDTKALAACMMKIINGQTQFDKEQIIDITRASYSPERIGKQFGELYQRYAIR